MVQVWQVRGMVSSMVPVSGVGLHNRPQGDSLEEVVSKEAKIQFTGRMTFSHCAA
jgi:hypothetical protein